MNIKLSSYRVMTNLSLMQRLSWISVQCMYLGSFDKGQRSGVIVPTVGTCVRTALT